MELIPISIVLLSLLSYILWLFYPNIKPASSVVERVLGIVFVFAMALFIVGLNLHATAHDKSIDPFADPCYSPISYQYSGSLFVFHGLSLASLLLLYTKEVKLPPLILAACISLATIGVWVDLAFLYQLSSHTVLGFDCNGRVWHLSVYPMALIGISVWLLVKIVKSKANLHAETEYKNRFLNYLNKLLLRSGHLPVLAMLLSVPVFLFIVLVLTLFGQDVDAMSSVFTDTATWKLSQKTHPPIVSDEQGHYLCTVAAKGSPKVVKPLRLGKRNNGVILVNRQLQVANAFEQVMQEISPRLHRFIRTNYDVYGLNLSKRILTERLSDAVYIAMKPLEWIFLIVLYCYYVHPEEVIAKQYAE
ncbi:MAG: hypothetical protein IT262_11060 [Saprospiraceae bacterium]|nr:hypothetical protein [Saprospiraceae bacterium]